MSSWTPLAIPGPDGIKKDGEYPIPQESLTIYQARGIYVEYFSSNGLMAHSAFFINPMCIHNVQHVHEFSLLPIALKELTYCNYTNLFFKYLH